MSCQSAKTGEFGSDYFEHSATTEAWYQIGGQRSWKPFKGESNGAFKARMQVYSSRLRSLLLTAGSVFVTVRCELKFIDSQYTLGILTVEHQPEAVDFAPSLMPIDIGALMRQVDQSPAYSA